MLNFHELLALQLVDRLLPETSFFLIKPATGACANRNDKHSDNGTICVLCETPQEKTCLRSF